MLELRGPERGCAVRTLWQGKYLDIRSIEFHGTSLASIKRFKATKILSPLCCLLSSPPLLLVLTLRPINTHTRTQAFGTSGYFGVAEPSPGVLVVAYDQLPVGDVGMAGPTRVYSAVMNMTKVK